MNTCWASNKQPQDIVIAGDSAGGRHPATLLIRDKGLPQPLCGLLSPGSNATPDDRVLDALDAGDAMLSADIVRSAINLYIPNENDRDHPYASPCKGNYEGICPLLITVTPDEVLYSDSKLVRRAAEQAGVKVEWIERPGCSMSGRSWCRCCRKPARI